MENPVSSFFNDLKKLVIEYIEARLQLTKISAYEKLAKVLSVLFTGLVLLIVFFFVLIALTMMFATMLNALFESQFMGYAVVAGVYFVGFILLVIYRKPLLEKYFTNTLIKVLFEDNEHDENKNN